MHTEVGWEVADTFSWTQVASSSSIRSWRGSALLNSAAKITAKAGPQLPIVQLSKGIPSFLMAHVQSGTHLQGLQESHGSVPCCAMPYVPVPMPQEVPRAAHHGHCSHHSRGAADLDIPTLCSQESMAVSFFAPHFLTQFPVKLHKHCRPAIATLGNNCRILFFSLVHSVEGCQLPVVRGRLWECQKRHEVSTLSQAEKELWAFNSTGNTKVPRRAQTQQLLTLILPELSGSHVLPSNSVSWIT